MAASISLVGTQNRMALGNMTAVSGQISLNTYATGGIALTPQTLGLGTLDIILFDMGEGASDGTIFRYDYTNQKVKAYVPVAAFGLIEVTNGTDLSTYTARYLAVGI